MTLKQLEAFVRIADNNSFSKTARELYLTQPTVSEYIGRLENELGAALFTRTTREVALTIEGRRIYPYARQMLELKEKITLAFRETEAETARMIISASSIPGTYLLPDILAEFSRTYPDVEFRVRETDSAGVVEDLRERRADIGFSGTVIGGKNVEFLPFYEDELVVAAPNTKRYRTLAKKPEDLSWLAEESWIIREEGSGTLRETMKLLRTIQIDPEALHVVACLGNTEAILMSVKNGTGISVVSRLAAERAMEQGELLVIPFHAEGAYRKINMVVSTGSPQTDLCGKMVRFVKKMYNSAGD